MAGFDLFSGDPGSDSEKVAYLMQLFNQHRVLRLNFELQWEESAALYLPEYRNSFAFGHYRAPGVKYTQQTVQSATTVLPYRFMAICGALLTPANLFWSPLEAGYPNGSGQTHRELMKDKAVRQWFYDVGTMAWRFRYRWDSGFEQNQNTNHLGLGVFGNQYMWVDEIDRKPGRNQPGVRYQGCDVGQIYALRNHQGRVDGCIRQFKLTARQAFQKWGSKIPPALGAALEQNSQTLYDFLHFVIPRTDYAPEKRLAPQGRPYWSTYLSVTGYSIVEEGGYYKLPLASGAYTLAPEEGYGRGPGQIGLPEAKTYNAERGVYLKQAHRAGDPTYLLPDDGLLDFKSHPGSYNYGGMSLDGKPLVGVLPSGEIQVTDDALAQSKAILDAIWLTDLFPLLTDDKGGQRNALQIVEEANHRGIFLAPTLGGQFSYLGALVDRELDILSRLRLLPPMPAALKEAGGEYEITFASPLAKAMRGQAVAGLMRTTEMLGQVANVTGDKSYFDRIDFDAATQGIAADQFVPPEWLASDAQMAAVRKQRAQAAERDQQAKELPGKAAIMKAQAITAKAQAGQNIGGTLSGTPEGGMPMQPGQAAPGGRAFGQPGAQPQP